MVCLARYYRPRPRRSAAASSSAYRPRRRPPCVLGFPAAAAALLLPLLHLLLVASPGRDLSVTPSLASMAAVAAAVASYCPGRPARAQAALRRPPLRRPPLRRCEPRRLTWRLRPLRYPPHSKQVRPPACRPLTWRLPMMWVVIAIKLSCCACDGPALHRAQGRSPCASAPRRSSQPAVAEACPSARAGRGRRRPPSPRSTA